MLSIIVVTTDRLCCVERLFFSLTHQTNKDFEVLLMHGAMLKQEHVDAVCRRFPELTIRAFSTVDACLSRSRNAALPLLYGEFFCIADDDCLYEPDTVAQVVDTFRRFPEIAALTGTAVGLEENIPPSQECVVVRNMWRLYRGCPSYVHFYRATILDTVQGFDENLGVGSNTPWQSGEETDFLLRTAQAGFTIMHASAVIVRHPRPDLRELSYGKICGYAAGRMQLLRKHNCSWFFVFVNVLYPLFMLFWECIVTSGRIIRYRGLMFGARLRNIRVGVK